MTRRIAGALACVLMVGTLSVSLGGVAHAGMEPLEERVSRAGVEPLGPRVEVRVGRRVAWVVVDLPKLDADRVRMEVRTPPDAHGARRTWQWCAIDYVGSGRYRCGVDIRRRTGARKLAGLWEASGALDGVTVGVVPFALS